MSSKIQSNAYNEQPVQDRIREEPATARDVPPEDITKSRWDRSWPVIACGAGLFSDGYVNGVIGSVNTILARLYGKDYTASPAQKNVSSITFAGTIVGMLIFGVTSDYWSRKWSLMVSTLILLVFEALAAGSYGANGSVSGLFTALTTYRFFLGIGIGGEYPAGSVAAAESTGGLKHGHRHRWFIIFTNFIIDFGFVMSSFVPMALVLIFTDTHLGAVWRVALGLGVIPPLSLLFLRVKLKEPEEFNRQRMRRFPYWMIIKYYWWRLTVVSLIWFIYDFSSYSFSIYSSQWLFILLGHSAPLWKSFAWSTVINMFYVPGAFAGAFLSDWIGPRHCLALGVGIQGAIGFIMAGCYKYLNTPECVAAFVVIYGIFLAFGEIGPGDNIGLLAAKTSATSIRGQYYGIAAAVGKTGAFIGTYVFPIIQARAGPSNSVPWGQHPFWVSSSLCIFSAVLAFFLVPHIGQDTIAVEDSHFRDYLEAHGYDTSSMGIKEDH